MDLDDSVQMTFQFKSFLFSKMQEYEAPRTWTVSIPATARNRAVIEQSQSADSTSNFPYTAYPVTYIDTNETIIDNGTAYMTGYSGGRINFVFVIGKTLGVLRDLSEVKLTDMSQRDEDIFNWDSASSYNDMTAGFGLVNWFNYTNEDRSYTTSHADMPMAVSHPVVTFEWLLNRIAYEFGITLSDLAEFPTPETAMFENIGYICKTKNGLISQYIAESIAITPFVFTGDPLETSEDAPFIIAANDYVQIIPDTVGTFTSYYFYPKSNFTDSFDLSINLLIRTSQRLVVRVKNFTGEPDEIINIPYTDIGGTYNYSYNVSDFRIGINPSRYVSIKFGDSSIAVGYQWFDPLFTSVCSVSFTSKNAFYGGLETGLFPIIPNLPDLTCAEFINQCCMLTGLFPYVDTDTPTVVNFYSVKTLYDNIPNAQNWSRYLLKSTEAMAEAEDMEFIIDGYSQVNRMQYKDDELNTLDTSGQLTVSNQNIPTDGELFTLAFAAGRRASVNNQIVDYPLYDIKIEAGQLIRNAKNQSLDIIGKIVSVGGVNTLQFTDDLLLSAIDGTTNYTYYQQLIEKPRIIREKFKITGAVLAGVDVRIPIYLEQYGQYYAILEAQITDTYEADVTLLEIK